MRFSVEAITNVSERAVWNYSFELGFSLSLGETLMLECEEGGERVQVFRSWEVLDRTKT